jgi:hypothetical protein
MAFGDVGGAVTELVITCETVEHSKGKKGDAVSLVGHYTVDNDKPCSPLFGEALADWEGRKAIPVKVRGISRFKPLGLEMFVPGCIAVATMQGKIENAPPGVMGGLVVGVYKFADGVGIAQVDVLL